MAGATAPSSRYQGRRTLITGAGSGIGQACVLRILAEGGTVVRPAEDTPYGRLASVTAPTGAAFNLSSLPD